MLAMQEESDNSDIVYRDVITIALVIIIILVFICFPFITLDKKSSNADILSPGSLAFQLSWDAAQDVDIDMWVQDPLGELAGFSSQSTTTMNLLRDDLGFHNDSSYVNMENIYTRGILPGEYVINAVLFKINNHLPPVKVFLKINQMQTDKLNNERTETVEIFQKSFELSYETQELTLIRFRFDNNIKLIKDSIHDLQMQLYYQ